MNCFKNKTNWTKEKKKRNWNEKNMVQKESD